MEFKIQKRERSVVDYSKEDVSLAKRFSRLVDKEVKTFVKAIVLFGSAARKDATKQSDIDILLIVDDVENVITGEVTETYRVIIEKIASTLSFKFHINTLKITSFWQQVMKGDPVIINILRDGLVLLDRGFFKPIQHLLDTGGIRPTKESIWGYYERAPISLNHADYHIMQACIDLYWACIDASHAALMSKGFVPPTPSHVPDMLKEHFVKKGLIRKKYYFIMKELFDLSKHITYRDIKNLSGAQYDVYRKETEDFIGVLNKIVRNNL